MSLTISSDYEAFHEEAIDYNMITIANLVNGNIAKALAETFQAVVSFKGTTDLT
jgi:hypothetical protein